MAKKKPSFKRLSIKQLKERLGKLKGARGTWDSHWQELADHILPRKNTVLDKKSEGQKRTWQLLDNVGMHSNELLAGALHGLLTNPNAQWFELTTGNLELDQDDQVRKWLQKTTREIHNVYNNSNFQTEIHELYMDLCCFGTSAMLLEEDKKNVIRFSTKFIADYWIAENHMGFVDEIHHEWKWSAAQIIDEFGIDNVGKKVREAFEKGKDEKFCCVHVVYPKYQIEEYHGAMPYISQYYLPDGDIDLDVGEFQSFPYVVPRWTKAAGETYGRSPGMNALPEIKVLNKMNETQLIGAQKMVDPPIQMPDDGFIMPIITRPGGINYYRPGTQDTIKPLFTSTNIEWGEGVMAERRKRVRDSYFVDQLQLQQGGPMMTATEVLQRTEEQMRLLGPMLGRQQSELLGPMIQRTYQIMWTKQMISEPPAILKDKAIDVRYSSLIAKSQRINDAQGVQRALQSVAPFIQLDPSVADNFNGDAAARIMSITFGMPQELLNDAKVVAEKRKQRAEAQQAAIDAQKEQMDIQNNKTAVETMAKMPT